MGSSPGGIIPRDMNARQWSEFSREKLLRSSTATKSFQPTWTGFSVDPTTPIYYKIVEDVVYLWTLNAVTGTSNSTSFSFTGGPAEISPNSTPRYALMIGVDNGNEVLALAAVAAVSTPATQMIFSIANSPAAPGNVDVAGTWTAAGSKGFADGWTLSYPLR